MLFLAESGPRPGYESDVLERFIARIAAGEREALAQLYQQTRTAVYGFALSITKHVADAEDVLQDTYLQVWQGAESYRAHGRPMAWLMTIVRNLALDRLRERARTAQLPLEDQWPENSMMTPDDRLTLEALLERLPDEERQVVVLHAITGLRHREIAALLKLPLSTVLSKYNRSVKKLQLAWKEAEEHAS